MCTVEWAAALSVSPVKRDEGGEIAAESLHPHYDHAPLLSPRQAASPDPRDAARFDGFEGCWLVWSIAPERRGGGGDGPPGDGRDDDGPPGRELTLPSRTLVAR